MHTLEPGRDRTGTERFNWEAWFISTEAGLFMRVLLRVSKEEKGYTVVCQMQARNVVFEETQ